jgi:hypothetical protein
VPPGPVVSGCSKEAPCESSVPPPLRRLASGARRRPAAHRVRRRPSHGPIGPRIMSFNAEFLWHNAAPEEGDATIDFHWKFAQADAEEQMRDVAAEIAANEPNITIVCKIGYILALTGPYDKFLSRRGYCPFVTPGSPPASSPSRAFTFAPARRVASRDTPSAARRPVHARAGARRRRFHGHRIIEPHRLFPN